MGRILTSQSLFSFEKGRQILSQQLKNAFAAKPSPKNRIARIEVPIEPFDFLAWLENQNSATRIYWSSRDGDLEMAGVGLTYGLHGTRQIDYGAVFTELERYLLAENNHVKFFGGFAFDDKSIDGNWNAFGCYRFVLPRFELVRREKDAFFACNYFADEAHLPQAEKILSDLQTLQLSNFSSEERLPSPHLRIDFPDKKTWAQNIENVIALFGKSSLKKVVLARQSQFKFTKNLHPFLFLKHLKNISPDCFHFCFQFDETSAFLGASPERLYKREHKRIKSEAIAGTRPRGVSEREDAQFQSELLSSPKENHEHMFVVKMIDGALKNFCADISKKTQAELLSLKSGQHLLTSFEGLLSDDADDSIILRQLHPTPAVGGFPSAEAQKLIHRLEPFKRGWYAAPVGCVGYDSSEFTVAIRSGLIKENTLFLYAGAGIVNGSQPQTEWDEIETKISNFTEIFVNGQPDISQP